MRPHFRTDKTSFGNSFLLLVLAAGMMNIDLFESDAVSGCNNDWILDRIELVFNVALPSQLNLPDEDIRGNDVSGDRILPSHVYATCFGTALCVIQTTVQVSSGPIYSSHNSTGSFNIPHQNSDEDDAFILPVDVA